MPVLFAIDPKELTLVRYRLTQVNTRGFSILEPNHWADHFSIHGVVIQTRTEIGEVTARILGFNQPERLLERELIQAIGGYPPSAAKERLLQNPD